MDVRKGNSIRWTTATTVEVACLGHGKIECLLLEVLADGLQIDKGGDTKGPEEVGVANTGELKKCRSLTRTRKCELDDCNGVRCLHGLSPLQG